MTQEKSIEDVPEERLHPRPQLTRHQWIDLCGTWGFTYDDANLGLKEGWHAREDIYIRTICVPFPPESPASGVNDSSFHPIVWYRRTFAYDPRTANQRLLLHCGAIDYQAQVWVNDQFIAKHTGGHTPFYADITSALKPGGEQVVVIRAQDDPADMAQPRGKQDWKEEPHSIWYHRTTGIWQPIWLEPVAETYISQVRWTPEASRGMLGLVMTLERAEADTTPLRVGVRLTLHGIILIDDVCTIYENRLQREFLINDQEHHDDKRERVLWSPEYPNLIEATFTIWEHDILVDEVQSYAGLRDVTVSSHHFLLNGLPYYLRMVLEQGYWPQSHLAAPSDESLRKEVELIKALGFNGVRIHQKVEDPRFLYWCDRLGLLVWGEMANAYVFSKNAVERFTYEWIEVLTRDYSHPCIVTWVPINESWGVPNLEGDDAQQNYVRAIYYLTKTLDPTRPVIGNDGWQHVIGDIISIHDYAFNGDVLLERYGSKEATEYTLHKVQPQHHTLLLPGYVCDGRPIMITEFGGISYKPSNNKLWYGYGTVTSSDDYLKKYRELVETIIASSAIAGFCYTQLTDTGQETNGLLTEMREPKFDLQVLSAMTRGISAAVPGDIAITYQEEAFKDLDSQKD